MSAAHKNPETGPTVTELLLKAKNAIESGDASLRDAAEAIAAAERKGAMILPL